MDDSSRPKSWHAAGDDGDDFNQIGILASEQVFKEKVSLIDDDEHRSVQSTVATFSAEDDSTATICWGSTSRSCIMATIVALIGALSAALFVGMGIASANDEQAFNFHHLAEELALQIEASWEDYETASRWLHQACSFRNVSRSGFRDLYEYMTLSLDVQSINWVPRVLYDDRKSMEEDALNYFADNYPDLDYEGFRQMRYDAKLELGYEVVPSNEEEFYYPAHFVEPVETNALMLDLDLTSLAEGPYYMERALTTWQPIISAPFRPFPGSSVGSEQNSIMLFHPGIPLDLHYGLKPKDLAVLVVNSKSIVNRVLSSLNYKTARIYLYDFSAERQVHTFMIGVDLSRDPSDEDSYYLEPIDLVQLQESTVNLIEIEQLPISSTLWTLVVVALDGEYEPNDTTVIVAGIFIFVACTFVAFWIWWDTRRTQKIQSIRRRADAVTAAIKLQSAQEHAKAEQELNEYIAHEIRNPLAAAMSACSFVKSAVEGSFPFADQQATLEDVDIIDCSLSFMDDLLRSMLDIHKAAAMKIAVTMAPADLGRDILQPVANMLYKRNSNFDVRMDCPDNLILSTDRLRLKQIVLNLGRNSAKFVEKGFIKLSARIVEGKILIFIDDSGPGIPAGKKPHLFSKFQESLDILEQGTGMGLCLCKNMSRLLGGDVWLDESYKSGIPGCPGTRFVVNTNAAPMSLEEHQEYLLLGEDMVTKELMQHNLNDNVGFESPTHDEESQQSDLPVNLSVLFVDDDLILRKLFSRSLKKMADSWTISEAANGEVALKMATEQEFDVIFLDQYMTSAEKSMLGTETARALRVHGVQSRICGLSANDLERSFLAAGADFFLLKPLPCNVDDLRRVLIRILASGSPLREQNANRSSLSTTTSTLPVENSSENTTYSEELQCDERLQAA